MSARALVLAKAPVPGRAKTRLGAGIGMDAAADLAAAALLDTLAAFLATDGSPTRAADELYCHRNTVMHRLRRIEQVTGRKVADPRARLQWQLALLGAQHGRPTQRSA